MDENEQIKKSAPEEVMAAYTRGVIEQHDQWDSLHQFMILGWDGQQVSCRVLAGIDPAVDPDQYPMMLAGLAGQHLEEHPGEPPYAYLLQIEGWAAEGPGPRPSLRPDRIEIAVAVCADIDGRLWACEKRRDRPGEIAEYFSASGEIQVGGRFADTVRFLAAKARIRRAKGDGHAKPR